MSASTGRPRPNLRPFATRKTTKRTITFVRNWDGNSPVGPLSFNLSSILEKSAEDQVRDNPTAVAIASPIAQPLPSDDNEEPSAEEDDMAEDVDHFVPETQEAAREHHPGPIEFGSDAEDVDVVADSELFEPQSETKTKQKRLSPRKLSAKTVKSSLSESKQHSSPEVSPDRKKRKSSQRKQIPPIKLLASSRKSRSSSLVKPSSPVSSDDGSPNRTPQKLLQKQQQISPEKNLTASRNTRPRSSAELSSPLSSPSVTPQKNRSQKQRHSSVSSPREEGSPFTRRKLTQSSLLQHGISLRSSPEKQSHRTSKKRLSSLNLHVLEAAQQESTQEDDFEELEDQNQSEKENADDNHDDSEDHSGDHIHYSRENAVPSEKSLPDIFDKKAIRRRSQRGHSATPSGPSLFECQQQEMANNTPHLSIGTATPTSFRVAPETESSGGRRLAKGKERQPPKEKTTPKNTKRRKTSDEDDPEGCTVRLWQGDQSRKVTDVCDLDIILNCFEETAWEMRQQLESLPMKQALNNFAKETQQNFRDTLCAAHSLKKQTTSLQRSRVMLARGRKTLLEAQMENLQLQREVAVLGGDYSFHSN